MSPSIKDLQTEKGKLVRKRLLKQAALVCGELAGKYESRQDFPKVLLEYEEMKKYYEELGDRIEVAISYRLMGETSALHLGQFRIGLEYVTEYLTISEGLGNCLETQRALVTLGRIYLAFGEHLQEQRNAKAQKIFAKAAHFFGLAFEKIDEIADDTCPEREKAEMRCGCLFNRYLVTKAENGKKTQVLFLNKLDEVAEKSGFGRWQAKVLQERMNIALSDDKLDLALQFGQKALACKKLESEDACYVSLTRANIFLRRRHFAEALETLREASRTKWEPLPESVIKNSLRGVKKLVRAVSWLERCEDAREKAKLCERLGDIAVKLKVGKVALEYYKDALEQGEASGDLDPIKRGELCYSIGKCYCEQKDYKRALKYYYEERKTVQFSADTSKQIMQCLAALQAPFEEVENEANLSLANAGDSVTDKEMIISTLQRIKENYDLKSFSGLFDDDEEEESEFSEDSAESDNGSDGEPQKRSKRDKVSLKPDLRGETTLHRLCKREGNLRAIEKIILGLRNVDLLDNSNFSPLHEACNYGFVEYAKVLHAAGADLNRVGGAPPDRITPLISACSNGHLEVIQYLLQMGAKVNTQDNCGWSALDHLERVLKQSKEDISEDDEQTVKTLLETMKNKLRKMKESGQNVFLIPKQKESKVLLTVAELNESEFDVEGDAAAAPSCLTNINGTQRPAVKHSIRSNKLSLRRPVPKDAESYVDAISSVGSRRTATTSGHSGSHDDSRKYNLSEREYDAQMGDDWMVDDLANTFSRRRAVADPFGGGGEGTGRFKKRRRRVSPSREVAVSVIVDDNDDDHQSLPDNDVALEPSSATEVPHLSDPEPQQELVKRVKISVNDRLMLIPLEQRRIRTVGQLCDETRSRYESTTGMRASRLMLTTSEGAELHPDDLVSSVISGNDETLVAKLFSWELAPLHERYATACEALGASKYRDIERLLTETQCSHRFAVSSSLRSSFFAPIFRALRGQQDLVELVLTRNKLGNDGVKMLCEVIPSLQSLRKLDLACNGVSNTGLNHLQETLSSTLVLPELAELNLGFNPLGDEAHHPLLAILEGRNLRRIDLQSCFFSSVGFGKKEERWKTVLKSLRYLEELNLSYNEILPNDERVIRASVDHNCICHFISISSSVFRAKSS